jgi:thymidine kinase
VLCMTDANGPFVVPGRLEVYCGPVKSSKSRTLVHRLDVLSHVPHLELGIFKPNIDTRDSGLVSRHGGPTYECTFIDVEHPRGILSHVEGLHLVVLDESQFFNGGIIDVVDGLMRKNYHVIAAGLDTDFRGEPFGAMPDLLVRATQVHKLVGVCDYDGCGEPGTKTQRLVDGEPALYSAPLISIEGAQVNESYECRCLRHHEVPGNPKRP